MRARRACGSRGKSKGLPCLAHQVRLHPESLLHTRQQRIRHVEVGPENLERSTQFVTTGKGNTSVRQGKIYSQTAIEIAGVLK